MADTWNATTKAKIKELTDKMASGQGGSAEVKELRELPEPPTGPSGLCKAHAAVWTAMREELALEEDPSKLARRAFMTKWLQKHERVITGVAACLGCEKPAPAAPTRDFSAEPPRGRRRGGGGPRRR